MDVVVKLVLNAALEVGQETLEKIETFAAKQYEENEKLRKVIEFSKSTVKKTGAAAVKVKNNVKDYAREKKDSFESSKKNITDRVDETADIVKESISKGYGAIETSRLYYQLGKLVYEQAISRDHSSYTYPIVEKIHDIADLKGDEDIIDGGGWQGDCGCGCDCDECQGDEE